MNLQNPKRMAHTNVQLSESKIWVTGGLQINQVFKVRDLKSTQFISVDKDKPAYDGPELPFSIANHSMVLVNSKNIYIVGGKQNGEDHSKKTWIVDSDQNFAVAEGPSLNNRIKYGGNSVAKMNVNGKDVLIAICFKFEKVKFEILDTTSPNQKWKEGNSNY